MDVLVPDWRESRAGARIRVALWLFSQVGEGGTFTKAHLRDAFPGVEQIDRRMRDLRAEGWRISTYREDRSLATDELRLVNIGGRVWEPGYRSRQQSISDTDRARALEADGYACRFCGISAGETYPDDGLRTAKLSVEQAVRAEGGTRYLRSLCERCMAGRAGRGSETDTTVFSNEVSALPDGSLKAFVRWTSTGRRERNAVETLWSRYRALPPDARDEIARRAIGELRQRVGVSDVRAD